MQEVELETARARVPVSTVLASIAGLWACYFVLTTLRAEILDLGFEFELLWRRVLVAVIGVAVTFAMWLILRLFDFKPLWIKVAAALVIAATRAAICWSTSPHRRATHRPRRRKRPCPNLRPRPPPTKRCPIPAPRKTGCSS